MQQKYNIQPAGNQVILKHNGEPCTCPFRPPFITPHPIEPGRISVNEPLCSSRCPHFSLTENKLHLQCTGTVIKLEDNKEPNAKKISLSP